MEFLPPTALRAQPCGRGALGSCRRSVFQHPETVGDPHPMPRPQAVYQTTVEDDQGQ